MIPGFGKQNLTVGSAPSCDVVLAGEGILPEHARIVHQGGGRLVFVAGPGASSAAGRRLAQGEAAPFDLRTPFTVGANTPVPLHHPAISLSLMTTGTLAAPPGQLILGRDPTRSSIVLQHPSVSSQHATVILDRMMVIDHGSTSGTYLGNTRIPPGNPVPIDPNGVVAFGPVPIQVQLMMRLAQASPAAVSPAAAQDGPGTFAHALMAPGGASPHVSARLSAPSPIGSPGTGLMGAAGPPVAGASKKNKTILGQIDFSQSESPVKSIGRTPDNDIVLTHAQVSSRHALLHRIGGQLYVEDRGSANGTFVRGHRIPTGQKIQVQSGEKIYIGPMPLQIEQGASGAAEVVQEDYAADRWAGRPLYEIEAWSLFLEVPDRDNPREMKVLLDNVSFKALPGDMIALMGPSGAGKTTLLLALNGYLPPTSGIVRINGEDLYNIYDTLRGSIGYVPQDDLVHAELSVFEAIRYSAKFRLPPDYTEEEIDARVEQTIKDLGLDGVKNQLIGKPRRRCSRAGNGSASTSRSSSSPTR